MVNFPVIEGYEGTSSFRDTHPSSAILMAFPNAAINIPEGCGLQCPVIIQKLFAVGTAGRMKTRF